MLKPLDEIRERASLICGDAIHNLRTALDHAWYELTWHDSGTDSKAKFPIYPTRKHLEDFLASREKQKSIAALSERLLEHIKPYKGGNLVGDALYHLNQIDIVDKHRLLISQTQVSHLWGEDAEYNPRENVRYDNIIDTYGSEIKDNRNLSGSIIFGQGTSVEGKFVLPTLKWLQTAVKVSLHLLE